MNRSDILHNFETEIKISYDIKFTSSFFTLNRSEFAPTSAFKSNRRLVVIDDNVEALFGRKLNAFFDAVGLETIFHPIKCTEKNKNYHTALQIIDQMEELKLLRKSEPVIAIGGGVLLDIIGFAAAIYRRGIPYIRVPTTLVGMIDAAVGLKTAVNYNNGRNRLGAYYSPIRCIIDLFFLETLTEDQIRDGLSEMLKIAIIIDEELFAMIENYGLDLLHHTFSKHPDGYKLIKKSIVQMSKQIESNPAEEILDRLPDFGHTFSPYIEFQSLKCSDDPLSHGQAVILDIYFSCIIASNRRILSESDFKRISILLDKLGLRKHDPLFLNENIIQRSLNEINIHRNNSRNILLPTKIGRGQFFSDLTTDEIKRAIQHMEKEIR